MATKRIQSESFEEKPGYRRDRYSRGIQSLREKGTRKEVLTTINPLVEELENFDWFNKSVASEKAFVPESRYVAGEEISVEERKLRMLRGVSQACMACSMCELGLNHAEKNNTLRDPHVFSNMKVSKVMIIGQNPGWDELRTGEPFAGVAGNNFDKEIAKHDLTRDDFYICNIVRCWTKGNIRPENRHLERCSPFLQLEVNILKPRIIVTLGAVAFSQVCPDAIFDKSLKKLTSSRFGVKVFPIYHPSSVNFRDASYRIAFEDQIRIMCELITKLHRFPD